MNYAYEIGPANAIIRWGTFTSDDLSYQGNDLSAVAKEMVNDHLHFMEPPTGEFRLWRGIEPDGRRPTGDPDYSTDVAALTNS